MEKKVENQNYSIQNIVNNSSIISGETMNNNLVKSDATESEAKTIDDLENAEKMPTELEKKICFQTN